MVNLPPVPTEVDTLIHSMWHRVFNLGLELEVSARESRTWYQYPQSTFRNIHVDKLSQEMSALP